VRGDRMDAVLDANPAELAVAANELHQLIDLSAIVLGWAPWMTLLVSRVSGCSMAAVCCGSAPSVPEPLVQIVDGLV
jgi:hypothetical protein